MKKNLGPLITVLYPLCSVNSRQIKEKAIDQKEQYILHRRPSRKKWGTKSVQKNALYLSTNPLPTPIQIICFKRRASLLYPP